METKLAQFIETLGEHRIKRDEPMALHTTFKVGGPADVYLEAETTDELIKAVRTAIELELPYFVFGGGSNMLVSDKGIRGVVIRNKTKNIKILSFTGKYAQGTKQVDEVYVEADSGIAMNYLVRYTIQEGLQGLECFLGLPGTVGGAIWNNSHFRQPMNEFVGNFVHSAKLLDNEGKVKEVDNFYFNFKYDYSTLHDTNEIVLSVVFRLKPGNTEELWKYAAEQSVQKRHDEQPLEMPSSGCTFQNVSKDDARRLSTPNGTQSAGYLIDQAGLKGTKIGNAMISQKHANFIVNLGGATAADIKQLAELARQKVKEKFAVELHEEIKLVGEWGE